MPAGRHCRVARCPLCPNRRCFCARPRSRSRYGFSLVELLVTITIISMLIGLLLPAVQAAREAARKTDCRNHLKQFALAVANFESQQGYYPGGLPTVADSKGTVNPWSTQAIILPYLEQSGLHSMIDFKQSYESAANVQIGGATVPRLSAARVSMYLCPSEVRDQLRRSATGVPEHYPINYAVNAGTWLVYNPVTKQGGDGVFCFDSKLRHADIRDGLSCTLLAAEVKAWQPYYRNAGLASDPGVPSLPAIATLGGQFKVDSGHTEWIDGRAHQTGFTTTFTPNSKVLCAVDSKIYDADWTNQQEGKSTSLATFAAVTARSHHGRGVHAARMDGSVHWVSDSIAANVWQALSTRAGREVVPAME